MAIQEIRTSTARPLPVILLADVSGSMEGHKIDALNRAVSEMLQVLADEAAHRAELQVAILTFGGEVKLQQPLAPAASILWSPLRAWGNTPLGAALTRVTQMLEDQTQIPSRAYRPTLILVSDGQPNDAWEAPLGACCA